MSSSRSIAERLRTNWQDPLIRRHVGLLFLGKAIGLSIVLTLITRWFLPSVLGAQAANNPPALDPMATVNAINTAWTLVAAFLVFGMQVGFVLLEAGFARSRESVNILVEGIVDTCICGVTFWAWGFAFMFDDHFGRHGGPLRVHRRHPLQHRRYRIHLSDHRTLGMGTRRLDDDAVDP